VARSSRIAFAGALYHITFSGDRREVIFEDDEDRECFLGILAAVVERYHWVCHADCLMSNTTTLWSSTVEGNLSQGMRQLSGGATEPIRSFAGRGAPPVSELCPRRRRREPLAGAAPANRPGGGSVRDTRAAQRPNRG